LTFSDTSLSARTGPNSFDTLTNSTVVMLPNWHPELDHCAATGHLFLSLTPARSAIRFAEARPSE
jgi:hypothetical protein